MADPAPEPTRVFAPPPSGVIEAVEGDVAWQCLCGNLLPRQARSCNVCRAVVKWVPAPRPNLKRGKD